MEVQPKPSTPPGTSLTKPTTTQPRAEAPTSRSEPSLRFPRPQGSQQLANWISSSNQDIMDRDNMQEETSLSDSTYEIISADGESQDGRGTESIADSLELLNPQVDDVQSVAGTEHTFDSESDSSDEEESRAEDEENHSHASSIKYADEALGSPSAHPVVSVSLKYDPSAEPAFSNIEFQEDDSVIYLDKISVKHTIRDFNEAETADIAENIHISNAPKRLIATVRQTMSQSCLSTREPLRLLYVGEEHARNSIVYKVSRAITSSQAIDYNTGKTLHTNTDGVFNIVPVTSFGSPKEPDVELMATSSYQIKVETCTSAEEMEIEGDSFPGDIVYCLTIDNEKKYKSIMDSAAQVQPAWSLPHVAIFYCSEVDDDAMKKTRDIAWEFTKRHAIPSIFISDTQNFAQPISGRWRDFVNEHAIHLSLESRDSDHPIPPQRLPIDLNSFLNIDARQMNRNLAYLTGLQEPPTVSKQLMDEVIALSGSQTLPEPDAVSLSMLSPIQDYLQSVPWRQVLGAVIPVLLAFVLGRGLVNYWTPSSSNLITAPAASLAAVPSTVPSASVSTSTATVTIALTSTKTVRITSSEPSSSGLPFGGFLSDKAQTAVTEPESKATVCSVEMYSGNEILIKVPSGTKTTWLAKGAIDIDVYRGNDVVKSRLSTVDEGILIEINEKDAHGVLNVSVVTTRKPKVNETFAVNFGKPLMVEAIEAGKNLFQDITRKIAESTDEAVGFIETTYGPVINAAGHKVKDNAISLYQSFVQTGKAQLEEAAERVKGSFNLSRIANAAKDAHNVLSDRLSSLRDVRSDVSLSVLRAQIASKLWWLQVQGRTAEHDEYERKAFVFLQEKHAEILNAKQGSRDKSGTCKRGRKSCLCGKQKKQAANPWKALGLL